MIYLLSNRRIFLKFIISLAVILAVATATLSAQNIETYGVYYATGKYQDKILLTLRKFLKDGEKCYLAVDLNTLRTQVINASALTVQTESWQTIAAANAATPYFKAITRAGEQALPMQDAGIVQGFTREKGVNLTIDLCPSHKPLDRVIFTSLISEFSKTEKPVPLSLSISGRFMLTHRADIEWLKSLEKAGKLSITWINHTYNHHYSPGVPLQENFLLKPGTDVRFEILGTEIAMLQHGLVPSVFFRFPGLVSDKAMVDKVLSFGLIPIGSDAWLAKGQQAAPGSIVLIHGNGNEPIGVNDFLQLLRSEKKSVISRQWLLYDLRESLQDEFEN
ncbi:polysaccharide deacetylase [Mucilaginibacter roseus]|uniref:Polysaccharide deacetylase n=1 Tax=Mucilaginibacter roseus TaxID=1528868 RepID=A0ABS8U2F2_9SPHI|nr:polysaccharide deacetylase [Mucilaginibacter roseus]MCD8740250.1 polysaccharide deacetylase [Mucilaginibacter roseus]